MYVLSWRGGRRDQGKWVWDDSYFGRALRRSWGCCGLGVAPLLSEPTQTDSPIVVQGIQRLNELATVKWTQQVIVEEEGNEEIWRRYLPDLLSGERVLLIAVGDVQGGVNLDELGEVDVQVEENRVTIDLPEPRILSASLNEDETKVYDRDRGLIDLWGDDALIEEARRDAVDEIQESAENNGIIEQAQTNAEDSLGHHTSSKQPARDARLIRAKEGSPFNGIAS